MNLSEGILWVLINIKINTALGGQNVGNNLDNNRSGFVGGDSLDVIQTRERKRIENERYSSPSYQRGESYTQGEARLLYPDQTNNCLLWVKKKTNTNTRIGDGGREGINSQEPKVGAIGVEKKYIHAVLIVAINGDDIIINESNFIKGWITERILHRSDFLGYII
jgi:hypothetical protein